MLPWLRGIRSLQVVVDKYAAHKSAHVYFDMAQTCPTRDAAVVIAYLLYLIT